MRLLSIVTTSDPAGGQLRHFRDALARLELPRPWQMELVIADDLGQWTDERSARRSAEHQPGGIPTRIIWYREKRGQLPATLLGVSEARGDAVLTIDPDMHHCLDHISPMLAMLDQNTDVIHGYRVARPGLGRIRRAGSGMVNILLRRLTGLPLNDFGSPVTLFRRALLIDEQLSQPEINPRLYLYMRNRHRLRQYPLPANKHDAGSSAYSLAALSRLAGRLLRQAMVTRARLATVSTAPAGRDKR